MTTSVSFADATDTELVSLSLQGEHEAFAAIVSRYQNLICSLAYSASEMSRKAKSSLRKHFRGRGRNCEPCASRRNCALGSAASCET